MKKIIIFMMFMSFQSIAGINNNCFNEKYLPAINNCLKDKLEINKNKLMQEYVNIENYLSYSQEHKKYSKDIIENQQDWLKVTTNYCDLKSYFVDKETITYEIQFNQCMNEKIEYKTSEINNLYEVISSMM